MASIDVDIAYYLDEVSTLDLLDELMERDINEIREKLKDWSVLAQYSTEELSQEIVDREDITDFKDELLEALDVEEESDELDLKEFDHSLFYMSEDDFSKLLKIIEYHKSKRSK